jgi:hypothetical protein
MIDEYMDKLPVIPATSVQEIRNRLQLFVKQRGSTYFPYVPVTELVIDDAHSFVEAWVSHGLHS